MRLDPNIIRQQIANLILQNPELEEDETLRADMIEGETDAFEFLRMIERQRQDTAALAGAIASNIAELGLRQERFERREKSLRALIMKIMDAADIRKAELPEATLSIRNGTPKVLITNENDLPDIACKFVRTPDKTKIKQLLATDPFFVAGATMSNAEPTLSIRTK